MVVAVAAVVATEAAVVPTRAALADSHLLSVQLQLAETPATDSRLCSLESICEYNIQVSENWTHWVSDCTPADLA